MEMKVSLWRRNPQRHQFLVQGRPPQPQLLRAAMIWHSRLLPEALPVQAPAEAMQGKALWVSHGTYDNVIPLTSAHAIRDHANALPLTLSYHEYPGAHEIRPEELSASMQWLRDLTEE